MKIIIKPTRVLTANEAAEYVGGTDNFRRLVRAGWIQALKGKKKGMDYDIKALDLAIDKVNLNGWPE